MSVNIPFVLHSILSLSSKFQPNRFIFDEMGEVFRFEVCITKNVIMRNLRSFIIRCNHKASLFLQIQHNKKKTRFENGSKHASINNPDFELFFVNQS